jgi:hypothetical protein
MYSIDNDDMLHNLKVGRQIIPGEEISLSCTLNPSLLIASNSG